MFSYYEAFSLEESLAERLTANESEVEKTTSLSLLNLPLNIHLEVSNRALSVYSESEIKKSLDMKAKIAMNCINKAFANTNKGRNIRVNLQVVDLDFLSKEEEKAKGASAYKPERDLHGNIAPYIAGKSTSEHTVSYFNTSVSHVPFIADKNYLYLLNTPDFADFANMEDIATELSLLKQSWSKNPFNPQFTSAQEEIINSYYDKEDKVSEAANEGINRIIADGFNFDDLVMSNRVKLMLTEVQPTSVVGKGSAITLAHELMHSFGGLKDRYIDPKNTTPNLMGAYNGGNECALTDEQVNHFIDYRGLVL